MSEATTTPRVDHEYDAFLARIQTRFLSNANGQPLFTTDAADLYAAFLAALPIEERQYHTCHACRRFVDTFGGLVTVGENGETRSALWDDSDAPELYQTSIRAMLKKIGKAKVTGVFYSSLPVWGQPVTGEWHHLSATPTRAMIHTDRTLTAFQRGAEQRENYGTLCRALADFTTEMLSTAVTFLKTEALYRSERVLGVAEWLFKLQQQRSATKGSRRDNITWRAVANAPAGLCHPRSSMIGTLLEDIAAGMGFDQIKERFAAKMNPTQYQRAQAAPSAGAIKQAEKLFDDLGLAPALKRRYATLEELPSNAVVWNPTVKKESARATNGVFGHLQPKGIAPAAALAVPSVTLTWDKFQRTVLPTAHEIEVLIPPSADRFMALVTAADQDAPPILQWDTPEARNAFSWYYASGIDAEMRRRLVRAGGRFEDVDIRASLMWNNRNDLDLHCITPHGAQIYYGNKQACRFGGWLDVDMNVSGETDEPVENIRWAKGRAQNGHYQFFVNHYRTHYGAHRTPFTVEIEVDGRVFTVSSESGIANPSNHIPSMVRVADFMYARGGIVEMGATLRTAATSPNAWGVTPGSYVPVTTIVRSPNLWSEQPQEQHGKHVFFLLRDCRDTQQGVGRGFFTEMLKSELRPVRSVLEAYNATASIDGEPTTCGIGISSAATGNITLRVDGRAVYQLDRWD